MFFEPKCLPRKPCDLSLRWKITGHWDAILFAIFWGKSIPTAVCLATGAFATENRGDLRLRFLVLPTKTNDSITAEKHQVALWLVISEATTLLMFVICNLIIGGKNLGHSDVEGFKRTKVQN